MVLLYVLPGRNGKSEYEAPSSRTNVSPSRVGNGTATGQALALDVSQDVVLVLDGSRRALRVIPPESVPVCSGLDAPMLVHATATDVVQFRGGYAEAAQHML